MKNKCIDCKKIIDKRSLRCQVCANLRSVSVRMKNRNQVGFLNPNYKHGRTLIKTFCIDCSKQLSLYASYYNCKRCVSCANKKTKCLQSHWNWQDGKSFEEYGIEFNTSLKEIIRKRDSYKCQECDCSQVENGRQLDVHHIDYNKRNNNINNLIALCHSCHMKTNFNRKYWKKRFSEFIVSKDNMISSSMIM